MPLELLLNCSLIAINFINRWPNYFSIRIRSFIFVVVQNSINYFVLFHMNYDAGIIACQLRGVVDNCLQGHSNRDTHNRDIIIGTHIVGTHIIGTHIVGT